MDPRYLTQLAVIVELGSISRAAERLNLTQPTLSRSVKIIEDRVGSRVLRRERHGVTATVIGQKLAEEGRQIIECSRAAQDTVDIWKLGLTGELRLGVGPMLAATIMGDFLARSVTENWSYALDVRTAPAVKLMEDLEAGLLDVVVAPAKLDMHQEALVQETLYCDRLAIYAAADDPLFATNQPVDLALLQDRPWIKISALSGILNTTRELLNTIGLPDALPRISFTGDINMLAQVVQKTHGFCFLTSASAPQLLERFDLRMVPITVPTPDRDIAFWTHRAKVDSPEIDDFKAKLLSNLADLGLTRPLK